MIEDLSKIDIGTLRRKRDQAWEMAGFARKDEDRADELRWINKAQRYAAEIGRRIREEGK
jgi:hypothetical protein